MACLLLANFTAWAGGDTETFPVERVDEIIVETDGGPVSLSVTKGPVVSVRASATDASCKTSRGLGGGKLTLTAHGQSSRMFTLDKPCSVGYEVGAPAGVRLTVRSVSGEVSVGPFSGPVDVKTGAGAITLNGPTGFVTLHSGRGAIGGTTRGPQVSASTQSGGISLSGLTAGDRAQRQRLFPWLGTPCRVGAGSRSTRAAGGNP